MNQFKVVETSDGSSSIYVEHLDEHYHSHHGAIQEANHVFINNGLKSISKKNLNVLEIGFGTGLNALLSLLWNNNGSGNLFYHSLETVPLGDDIISELNYTSQLEQNTDVNAIFKRIHVADWQSKVEITDRFTLLKENNRVQDSNLDHDLYDIVFYDAFGHRAQSEMWDKDIFEKLYKSMKLEGILVTYCSKGQFKRDLKSIGFEVQSLPGPPGKREMTRAIKR